MTDKNLADSKSEITVDRDPFFDLWSKAKLIGVGGPLHRSVPKKAHFLHPFFVPV